MGTKIHSEKRKLTIIYKAYTSSACITLCIVATMYRFGIFSFLSAAAIIFTQPAVSYQYFGTKTSYFVNANTDDRSVNFAVIPL